MAQAILKMFNIHKDTAALVSSLLLKTTKDKALCFEKSYNIKYNFFNFQG
jgi:hypothetical protein